MWNLRDFVNWGVLEWVLIALAIAFIPALIYSIVASVRVKRAYNRAKQIPIQSGITGEQVARAVLHSEGVYNVQIMPIDGRLEDHYDPRSNTIRLSNEVFYGRSVAAAGIAAHEAGHALQYAERMFSIRFRTAIVPYASFAARYSMPFLLFAILIEFMVGFNIISNTLLLLAVIFYASFVLFTLVTLPVEFNASRRAKQMLLAGNILTVEEKREAKRILNAAAQTYVAQSALALATLARLLLMLLSRRR